MRQDLARLTLANTSSGGRRVTIGSLGESAGEGDFECAEERGLGNAAAVITPARKFRMLLHTNSTRERGEYLGTRAGASEDM